MSVNDGFDEGIALDHYGFVSEGSGENIFIVRHGVIFTPPSSSSILPGITRHCVFTLARDFDIRIHQQVIPREGLYVADEVFFSGTAAGLLASFGPKAKDAIPYFERKIADLEEKVANAESEKDRKKFEAWLAGEKSKLAKLKGLSEGNPRKRR